MTRIQTIATGSTRWDRLIRRWGVSFLVGEDVLFDTFGDPVVFLNNIRRFRVDPMRIKHVVLSHDDWDHIGGLRYLVEKRSDATVYICPGFSPEAKQKISSFAARLIEAGPGTMIKEGVFTSGPMPGAGMQRALFEQALVLRRPQGLVVITGCAHPGIVEVVDAARRLFPQDEVGFIMGGFHLKDASEAQISRVVEALRARNVSRVAPTHCTGARATRMFREVFGGGFLSIREGSILSV